MTRNYSVFGVIFFVTVAVSSTPFFSNKPALANCTGLEAILSVICEGEVHYSPRNPSVLATILNFCNHTNLKLYVAHVKNDGNQGWLANGWKRVNPKSCDTLNIDVYQGDIFLYAYNEQGGIYSQKDAYFCVDKGSAFNFANADTRNCNGGSLKKVGTTKWKVDSGTNTYNFN